jgi:leucyl aminopeptidase
MENIFSNPIPQSIPLTPLTPSMLETWMMTQDEAVKVWVANHHFQAKPRQILNIPNHQGKIQEVIWGLDEDAGFWQWATLAQKVPQGLTYHFSALPDHRELACLAWGLAFYRFDNYKQKTSSSALPQLVWPDNVDTFFVQALLASISQIRNWITTPACDCLPHHLADIAHQLAKQHKAQCKVIMDEALEHHYPSIYTVGKAAEARPCLIDLTWSHDQAHPKITLVGKGVCFDSGGLDIKPSSNMLLMKKDMGGAAHVLGLAHLIMSLNLPIQLRVLIPAVENAISGNAMRPLDVIRTKKGLTVEISNTDAEGRLILADALYEASCAKPDLIIDFATLTGAARIAMGTDIPVFFCNREEIAHQLMESAKLCQDPLWSLPLYPGYKKQLQSSVADLSSTGKSSYGGAIIAGLFLEHFVDPEIPWIHLDLMAWNLSSRPGQPEGGEAMGLRAVFHFIRNFITAQDTK